MGRTFPRFLGSGSNGSVVSARERQVKQVLAMMSAVFDDALGCAEAVRSVNVCQTGERAAYDLLHWLGLGWFG